MSQPEDRLLLLLRDGCPLIGDLALAELALGLVRLERGALTESLVAVVAYVRALPGVGPEYIYHFLIVKRANYTKDVARFGDCFLRVQLMYQPCCLVPCCQSKLGELSA